jgi:isoquinoline 1-oxidoreductase
MLMGKVLRAPVGSTRPGARWTPRAAEAMPGVVVVRGWRFRSAWPRPTNRARPKPLPRFRAEWNRHGGSPSSRDVFDYLRSHPAQPPGFAGPTVHSAGSIKDGLAQADHTLETTHTVAYIAHAPPEPRAAVAKWGDDGRLTVWTGTQRPFGVRGELAGALNIADERIRVIVPDTGSGYGGKHTGEAAIEAARLARGAGRPVKIVWTREEEFCHAYVRPAGVIDIRSGVRNDGHAHRLGVLQHQRRVRRYPHSLRSAPPAD